MQGEADTAIARILASIEDAERYRRTPDPLSLGVI
jgi:hypothetical protein